MSTTPGTQTHCVDMTTAHAIPRATHMAPGPPCTDCRLKASPLHLVTSDLLSAPHTTGVTGHPASHALQCFSSAVCGTSRGMHGVMDGRSGSRSAQSPPRCSRSAPRRRTQWTAPPCCCSSISRTSACGARTTAGWSWQRSGSAAPRMRASTATATGSAVGPAARSFRSSAAAPPAMHASH